MDVLSTTAWLRKLADADPKARRATLKSLAEHELDDVLLYRVVEIFREDRRGQLRVEALNVLARGWPRAEVVAAFTEALQGELFLAERAVALLGDLADERAFDLLEGAFLQTRNVWVKIRVLGVLHKAPQARLFEFLRRTAALSCPEDNIRATVVAMLSRLENPSVGRIFVRMLKDRNDRVRANAVEGLGRCMTGLPLAKLVLPYAVDRNNRVRANALVILLRLGAGKLEQSLLEMATHANVLFRASAAWALGEIPFASPRRELLNRLLRDADEMVARQAERALEKQLAPTLA